MTILMTAFKIWQNQHAGALTFKPTFCVLAGPGALNPPKLTCLEIARDQIGKLPSKCASTANLANEAGFVGVEMQAGDAFPLSEFLLPLFNPAHGLMHVAVAALRTTRDF